MTRSKDSADEFLKPAVFENPGIRRLCDIVMKGGVTSGVVYPLAICKLATSYVIKGIGGTSVGAIAAAVTAAAEYRRRHGSGQGYVELAKLPGFLGRKGVLLALFAADDIGRPLLNIALTLIGNASPAVKLIRLTAALLIQYFWVPLLTIAIIFGCILAAASPLEPTAIWHCFWISVVFGVIASSVFVALLLGWRVISVLDRNNFGWCHGYSRAAGIPPVSSATTIDPPNVPPLFNWLEAFIAQAAGISEDKVLTFGDLWSAKRSPSHESVTGDGERNIDFRMVTTCLTLGRPFEIPFDPNEQISQHADADTDVDADGNKRPPIYFREKDMREYFSAKVVQHMLKYGAKTNLGSGTAYYRFPAAENVPIIVATRLSMSFPILFCALPLYACDATGKMQRIWFSDGGLTSNFPIHFFDSPLPQWPTFAVDLLGGEPDSGSKKAGKSHRQFAGKHGLGKYIPGAVFMESDAPPGTINPWDALDRGNAPGNVLAFGSSILDAARGWQDVTLATLPGNKSRIVGIRLSDDQGGLNLNMSPDTIEEMSGLGLQAGSKLVTVFGDDKQSDAPGWVAHRWTRYRATMGAIVRWASGFATGYAPFAEQPLQASYRELIAQLLPSHYKSVPGATEKLAAVAASELAPPAIAEEFFDIEQKPIAVLPMRPVV